MQNANLSHENGPTDTSQVALDIRVNSPMPGPQFNTDESSLEVQGVRNQIVYLLSDSASIETLDVIAVTPSEDVVVVQVRVFVNVLLVNFSNQ